MAHRAVLNRCTTTDLAREHTCKLSCLERVTTMLLVDVLVAHTCLLLQFKHVEALACCLEGLA